ncbi:LysR substrate-binding domain-containing protein [Lacibacterium aquatile]|uniref:LysR substrate-binding domain-containing protein n=1 Tax=Lacibacterium aquatile TaxID=1168082 RepID=A0ABW5DQ23_9PROT
MLNLNDLQYFVRAVEQGGFAAAGRLLRLPKSTLSKRVAELEASLGARLIERSSRSFVLTDVGRDFYDHARAALIEAESAEAAVRSRLAEPSGTVRLTASVPTTQYYLADHLPDLARAYPRLRLEVHATDRFVDLVQEGFDIALRAHFAPLPDSSLLQRVLGTDPIWLVASPDYLVARGTPTEPGQLAEHDGILTAPANTQWRLSGQLGETTVTPQVRMVADESRVLMEAAAGGLGITCLPKSICRAHLQQGRLVQVLPEWQVGGVTTSLLMPQKRHQLPGVRAVADFLYQRLGGN